MKKRMAATWNDLFLGVATWNIFSAEEATTPCGLARLIWSGEAATPRGRWSGEDFAGRGEFPSYASTQRDLIGHKVQGQLPHWSPPARLS
jgi:hypothetical protein